MLTFCPFCGGFGVILMLVISILVLSSAVPILFINRNSYTFIIPYSLLQSFHELSQVAVEAKTRKSARIMMAFIFLRATLVFASKDMYKEY